MMLRKDELKDGAYYSGECRNVSLARWSAQRERFFYLRDKFGHQYLEGLPHPDDDEGWDIFTPELEVELPEGYPADYPAGFSELSSL